MKLFDVLNRYLKLTLSVITALTRLNTLRRRSLGRSCNEVCNEVLLRNRSGLLRYNFGGMILSTNAASHISLLSDARLNYVSSKDFFLKRYYKQYREKTRSGGYHIISL